MGRELFRRIIGAKETPAYAPQRQVTVDEFHQSLQSSHSGELAIGRVSIDEERRVESYLASLSETDRGHVSEFIDLAYQLNLSQKGSNSIAVLAVGSTTIPEEERDHPVSDIDLRIVSSTPKIGFRRASVIATLKQDIRKHLSENAMQFSESHSTAYHRKVEASDGSMVPWTDYANNQPSFHVRFPEGLPLHISIAGVDSIAKDKYLKQEAKHRTSAVVLLK